MYNHSLVMLGYRKLLVWVVRLLILLSGLYILAQGIAFTVIANLGTDAITSPALVAHKIFGVSESGMEYSLCTVGNMLICIHVLLVLVQIAVLRRQYKPVQLLQVVMGLILGWMLDCSLSYTSLLPVPGYIAAVAYTLLGCVLCAFGIFTYVKADMVPLSAEGLCLALSNTYRWRFSRVKVAVDCSMLLIAVLASICMLSCVVGVREGSVICAVCTGYIIGWLLKKCPIWDKLLLFVSGGDTQSQTTELS